MGETNLKTIARFVTLAALGSALAASAFAGTTVNLQFNGAVNSQGGVGTYPYSFTRNGTENLSLLCDTFSNEIIVGETWQATVHDIYSAPKEYNVSQQTYNAAAYIFMQILADPGDVSFSNRANYAIWGLFEDLSTNPTYIADNSAVIANNALIAVIGMTPSDFADIILYTPVDGSQNEGGPPQEFFGLIPEPSSMALLGTGMLGIAFAGRKLWA